MEELVTFEPSLRAEPRSKNLEGLRNMRDCSSFCTLTSKGRGEGRYMESIGGRLGRQVGRNMGGHTLRFPS